MCGEGVGTLALSEESFFSRSFLFLQRNRKKDSHRRPISEYLGWRWAATAEREPCGIPNLIHQARSSSLGWGHYASFLAGGSLLPTRRERGKAAGRVAWCKHIIRVNPVLLPMELHCADLLATFSLTKQQRLTCQAPPHPLSHFYSGHLHYYPSRSKEKKILIIGAFSS